MARGRRARFLLIAVGVLLLGGVLLFVFVPRSPHKVYRLEIALRWNDGTGSVTKSWLLDTPPRGGTAAEIKDLVSRMWKSTLPVTGAGDDITHLSCQLRLEVDDVREKPWVQTKNLVRKFRGKGPVYEYERVGQTLVTESSTLYLRSTPEGQYYVSSRQDRDGMLHRGLIPPDSNVTTATCEIMSAYWNAWMVEANEATKRQP